MDRGNLSRWGAIDLSTPLSLRAAFRFPIQSAAARRDLLWGAVLLVLLPGPGWILNMGHRIRVVHQMQNGRVPWPAWSNYPRLFKDGLITLCGMLCYYAPGIALAFGASALRSTILKVLACMLVAAATMAIPGFMSHYCRNLDPAEIYNPLRSLHRCIQGGGRYWQAWSIALCALVLSFVGLLGLGVGFLITSVWFWQVAGFAFAAAFTRHFGLD